MGIISTRTSSPFGAPSLPFPFPPSCCAVACCIPVSAARRARAISASYSASRRLASGESIRRALRTAAWSLLSSEGERAGLPRLSGVGGAGRRCWVGIRTDGMGVDGCDGDWKDVPRRSESTRLTAPAPPVNASPAPAEADEGVPAGSSPGRRKPARLPGRLPPPLERAASLVNMYRSCPPGVLEPLPAPADPPAGPPRPLDSRRPARSSRIFLSSTASSKSLRVPYRSMATSSIARDSVDACSYVRRSLVIRHCDPGAPATTALDANKMREWSLAGRWHEALPLAGTHLQGTRSYLRSSRLRRAEC